MINQSLLEKVISTLQKKIIHGEFKPGQHLIERDIAEELGVSRTPIREAFRSLESSGFISVLPKKGAMVSSLDLNDMKELYEMRSVLEGLAGRFAVDFVSDKNILLLNQIHREVTLYAQNGDYKLLDEANTEFHFSLYEISQRARLIRLIKELWSNAKRMRATTLSLQGRAVDVIKEHEKILEFLVNRDGKNLEIEIRNHVMNAARALIMFNYLL